MNVCHTTSVGRVTSSLMEQVCSTSDSEQLLHRTQLSLIQLSLNAQDSLKSAVKILILLLLLQHLSAISQSAAQDTRMVCLLMSKTKESQTLSLVSGLTCVPFCKSVRFPPHMEVQS